MPRLALILSCLALACSAPVREPSFDATVAEVPPELAPTVEDAGAPDAALLRLGAFNVRRLGLDAGTDVALVARIIEQSFDLVGIVEIMQSERGGHPGLDALLEALGAAWSAQVTDSARPPGDAPYAEHYAVLMREARVRPCDARASLTRFDGAGFLRAPAWGCYAALDREGRVATDLVLAVYHARWGDGATAPIVREVSQLDAVIETMRRAHPEERDLYIAGDFNLEHQALAQATRAHDRTRGLGSTLTPEGTPSTHLYDHLLVVDDQASRELVGDAWVLDARATVGGPLSYHAHVSDHLPIVALLRTDLGDDD